MEYTMIKKDQDQRNPNNFKQSNNAYVKRMPNNYQFQNNHFNQNEVH